MAEEHPKDDRVYLEDMLFSIAKVKEYTRFITEDDFERSEEKQDAVLRRISILGEAAKKVSMETKSRDTEIPWRAIAGMRDIVIHQYFGVSLALVWRVVISDLPRIEPRLKALLASL